MGPRGQGEPGPGCGPASQGCCTRVGSREPESHSPSRGPGEAKLMVSSGRVHGCPPPSPGQTEVHPQRPRPGEVSALTAPDFAGALPDLVSGPHHKVEASRGPEGPSRRVCPGTLGPAARLRAGPARWVQPAQCRSLGSGSHRWVWGCPCMCVCARVCGVAGGEAPRGEGEEAARPGGRELGSQA